VAKGGYQQRRLEQKRQRAKQARKRARRRKLLLQGTATAAVFGLIIAILVIVLGGNDEGDLASGGTPTPSASPTTAGPPEGCAEASPASEQKSTFDAPPEMQIDAEKTYTATIETNCGTVTATLFAKDAPKTVNNFVFLAREDFFDGLLFHRVIADFMIQGGDPQGTGSGGPGYQFEDENLIDFDRPGLLAMANSGPATNGSQFFITEAVTDWLNGKHSIFGEIIEGQEVLDRITSVVTDGDPPSGQNRPLANIVILDVTITEA